MRRFSSILELVSYVNNDFHITCLSSHFFNLFEAFFAIILEAQNENEVLGCLSFLLLVLT